MLFLIITIITALSVASAAAFFSILGLIETFTMTTIVWGSVIEGGKLVAASFLYRFWNQISILWKAWLTFTIIVLMLITSLGIFGHITVSYQKDSLEFEVINT